MLCTDFAAKNQLQSAQGCANLAPRSSLSLSPDTHLQAKSDTPTPSCVCASLKITTLIFPGSENPPPQKQPKKYRAMEEGASTPVPPKREYSGCQGTHPPLHGKGKKASGAI